jgi:hypothetical protein
MAIGVIVIGQEQIIGFRLPGFARPFAKAGERFLGNFSK